MSNLSLINCVATTTTTTMCLVVAVNTIKDASLIFYTSWLAAEFNIQSLRLLYSQGDPYYYYYY